MLTVTQVKDYQSIAKKHYDKELSFEEASESANRFVSFAQRILRHKLNSVLLTQDT